MTYTRLWPRNGKTNSFCYYTSATKGLGELLRAMYKEFGDCCPPIHRMSLHEKSLEPDDIMEQFVLTWNRVQLTVLPLLGGDDTVGRRRRGLEVAAWLRGGGEASWEAAVLVTERGRGWEASRVGIPCDTQPIPFPLGPASNSLK
ncbi:hypothetical protein BDA96_03G288700 [Sorghum bicolor]|uniref:Uncharacterized protein n=2 Tax=Sorghum bicolor TaxID=4558 RepID=A0A921RH01_SORBI|nr:hypothetical protein BDA96_03G288700 [Sorghum bicolor]KXG33180.2 hypothetical protein SORBI_3003G267150 [Sorghum bicolor]